MTGLIRPFIIPIFMPNAACPHPCVFCNQKAVSPADDPLPSPQEVDGRIARFLSYKRPERKQVQIAFYGGNFLGLPQKTARAYLGLGQKWVDEKRANGLRLSTRPDTIDGAGLACLADFSVQTVEMGVQSMDDAVLAKIKRGHGAKETAAATRALKSAGFQVGLQLMVGLPGEDEASVQHTARAVAALGPDFVRIHPTLVLKNTVLEKWRVSGAFRPLSLEQAVHRVKLVYEEMARAGICVVRMGLHPDGELTAPGTVTAGPFHPAFGELVLSALFEDSAVKKISDILAEKGPKPARITLTVHPRKLSAAFGPKKSTLARLAARFPEICLEIKADAAVPDRHGAVTTRMDP